MHSLTQPIKFLPKILNALVFEGMDYRYLDKFFCLMCLNIWKFFREFVQILFQKRRSSLKHQAKYGPYHEYFNRISQRYVNNVSVHFYNLHLHISSIPLMILRAGACNYDLGHTIFASKNKFDVLPLKGLEYEILVAQFKTQSTKNLNLFIVWA
jgi:hypothetical protein